MELRRQLKDAELAHSVREATATMHGVIGDGGDRLGPTIRTPIEVDGVAADALVDTGSPATIVSLEFLLKAFIHNRPPHQTPQDWQDATLAKFTTPEVTLSSYRGKHLELTAQTKVRLSQGKHSTDAVVLVQRGAPNELLLGTDLQPRLGFSLTVDEVEGPRVLFGAGADGGTGAGGAGDGSTGAGDGGTGAGDGSTGAGDGGTGAGDGGTGAGGNGIGGIGPGGEAKQTFQGAVCLLKAARVPPQHRKVIRAAVGEGVGKGLMLFTPMEVQKTHDLLMVDCVVEVGEERCVSLLVENHGGEVVRLEEGEHLGQMAPAEVLESSRVEELTESSERKGDGLTKDCDGETGEYQLSESQWLWEATPSDPERGVQGIVVGRLESGTKRNERRTRKLLDELDAKLSHLDEKDRTSLTALISEYAEVFALDPSELGCTHLASHTIDTGDQKPIRQSLRRTPFALRRKVDGMVEEMLEHGVISPSKSPWASPIVLIKKKDGGLRFCVDYRKVNAAMKLDEFPLPRIDDTLDLLAGSRYFTTLDLASGYWQGPIDPASQEKTAFTTFSGLYEFTKMPFGLVNAPATFQRLMEVVLSDLARDVCLVYLDDILVMGKTFEEHTDHLKKVFERIHNAGLRLKPKKYFFAQEKVEYLGHVVSAGGISTDPAKLSAISQFPTPTTVKTLRSFLGLASYYRKFVPRFAKIAQPLHALTKKDTLFEWTQQCQSAYDELKELLMSSPVLAYPDFSRAFILETDASAAGLGAVLAQEQGGAVRPIAFASRSLQPHEKNYGVTEMEGLGVVWAVKHFRPYLYGHKCTVYTDHEALKAILNTPQPSGKLARWGMAIQELDITIIHRPGRNNANADALISFPTPQ